MKISLIGAGNVGYHLAHALQNAGHDILQIFSRNPERFTTFDTQHNFKHTQFVTNLHQLQSSSNQPILYLIAVHDKAIQSVANQLTTNHLGQQAILAHSSGATPMDSLSAHPNHGIFYPLQTFTRNKKADWTSIPFCIHGNSQAVTQTLANVAKTINKNVYFINDQERQFLHLAAVFVNNFTNHLLAVAEDILQDKQLPLDLLQPLIRETFTKIQQQSPQTSQTGPARRKDTQTIQNHLLLLEKYPDYEKLYKVLTKSIQNKYLLK